VVFPMTYQTVAKIPMILETVSVGIAWLVLALPVLSVLLRDTAQFVNLDIYSKKIQQAQRSVFLALLSTKKPAQNVPQTNV
jgi:uncharacterized membrane protein